MNTEQINLIKEQLLYQLEQMNEKYTQSKLKIEEHEFKINNIGRLQESIKNNMTVGGNGNGYRGSGYEQSSPASSMLTFAELETEVKLLRG